MKNAGKIAKNIRKLQEAFPKKEISFLGLSHGCQNFYFLGNNFQKISFFGNFPRLLKLKKGPKKSEKFQKIIKNFPRSLERAENAKNVWEIMENRGKFLK